MELFYTIVIAVALVFLVVIFTLAGLAINNAPKTTKYPANQSTCPDYWTANPPCDSTNPNIKCCPANSKSCCGINPVNVGNAKTNNDGTYSFTSYAQPTGTSYSGNTVIDFGDPSWQSSYALTTKCALKKWANLNNVEWDGVTNFNGC